MESLNLYEALPSIEPFHACRAPDRILRGSNRGGKTLSTAVEVARAVTGQDPYKKYPTTDGRCFIVGKDGKHNAEVLFRKLCRPNAFRIIIDKETGKWRSWKPWVPGDKERELETKPAKPLIPRRMIKAISWESLKEQNPSVITLTNGWELRFFSSLGAPPQGSDIDLAWFDEEVVNTEWYPEISARLIDRNGKFIWSATAQRGGPQLYDLYLQAEECRNQENPRLVDFFAHIDHNHYFTDEMRDLFFSKLTDEQRRIRIDGEFAFTGDKVYPEYSPRNHNVEPFAIDSDWARYMVVDPGRQVCAILFAAIPPPHEEEMAHNIFLYDELYLRNCDEEIFGTRVREKTQGQAFQSFIIDYRGSRVRLLDSGVTVEQRYAEALKKYGVSSIATGHGFTWASDDVQSGIMAARALLLPTKDKPPRLKVFDGRLPNFEYEIQRYRYKRDRLGLTEDVVKRNNHLMDTLRYLAMYEPTYIKPKPPLAKYNPAAIVQAKKRRKLEEKGPDFVSLS